MVGVAVGVLVGVAVGVVVDVAVGVSVAVGVGGAPMPAPNPSVARKLPMRPSTIIPTRPQAQIGIRLPRSLAAGGDATGAIAESG